MLIGVSEGEREFIGVKTAVALIKSIRDAYDYPIFLNADHTHSLDKAKEAAEAGFDEADQLSMVNVAIQVQTLQDHPLVVPRLADGSVSVVGLFLELGTARLFLVGSTDIAEIGQDHTYLEGLREVAR